jgi:hypothetical protein
MSTDGWKQPLLGRGLTGGLALISAELSDLKQSVRVEIRWLHGPPSHPFQALPATSSAASKSARKPIKIGIFSSTDIHSAIDSHLPVVVQAAIGGPPVRQAPLPSRCRMSGDIP